LGRTFWLQAGCAAAGAVVAGALAYARYIEPFRWQVTSLELRLARLGRAFDGLRVVHLSDLHMSSVTTAERLMEVVALANALQPDVIALTGDYVIGDRSFDGAALAQVLGQLRAPEGMFAVLGNHDRRPHVEAVRRALRAGGAVELDNTLISLRRGQDVLHIAGVDSFYRRRARLDRVLYALPASGCAVLLAHEPDFADVAAPTHRFDLQLSGHAHGGQVRVPGLTRFGLPKYGERYVQGLHMVGDMLLYVSRGLGMTTAPLRLNCRPEITLLVLRSPAGSHYNAV